jgi:hypothetical protein
VYRRAFPGAQFIADDEGARPSSFEPTRRELAEIRGRNGLIELPPYERALATGRAAAPAINLEQQRMEAVRVRGIYIRNEVHVGETNAARADRREHGWRRSAMQPGEIGCHHVKAGSTS